MKKRIRVKTGDLVRLKRPFIPNPNSLKEYRYALVVSVIWTETENEAPKIREILTHLCEGDRSLPYTEEDTDAGIPPLYSFYPDEIELIPES